MILGLLEIRDLLLSQDHSRILPQGPGVSLLSFQNVGVVERSEVRDSLPMGCRFQQGTFQCDLVWIPPLLLTSIFSPVP